MKVAMLQILNEMNASAPIEHLWENIATDSSIVFVIFITDKDKNSETIKLDT